MILEILILGGMIWLAVNMNKAGSKEQQIKKKDILNEPINYSKLKSEKEIQSGIPEDDRSTSDDWRKQVNNIVSKGQEDIGLDKNQIINRLLPEEGHYTKDVGSYYSPINHTV